MEPGQMKPGASQDENDKHRLVLKLITRLRCPECGRLYDTEDFALTHRWQDVWVLSTRCRHCNELCHVVVFMYLDAEPEPADDLTPEELGAIQEWPKITTDDVLDIHVVLQQFDGDIEALFDH
jgi:hypothetical protein